MRIIALHHDIAIRVLGTFAELDISPLDCNQFAFAESSPKSHQEQRVEVRAEHHDRCEKGLGLSTGQRFRLVNWFCGFRESSKLFGWIVLDDAILDGMVQYYP